VTRPAVAFATPRKLPRAAALTGRVVVLDIAFAAAGTGSSFEKVTGPFLAALGDRLAAWVDHHDHNLHAAYRADPRFTLCTKAVHGACPEMITPALVAAVGPVDTVLCHNDFDGLYAAAKWLLGGTEPYPGADDDARAIDTRTGVPSARGARVDRALRLDGRDEKFLGRVVDWLVGGCADPQVGGEIEAAAARYDAVEARTRDVAGDRYTVSGQVAWCDITDLKPREVDKTELLLLGQKRATVSVLTDEQNVTLAAAFGSGLDFLAMLGVAGGMPTRVSVPRSREAEVRAVLARRGLMPA
jgi:hypothetical protein